MENFLLVAQQVCILFILMGIGAVLQYRKVLTQAAMEGFVNLLFMVVMPCLMINAFQRPFDPSMLKGLLLSLGISFAAHIVIIAIALLCIRHRNENIRRPLLLAAVFSNAGFMGLPLESAVLGNIGVFYGAVYVAVFNLVMWSWGYKTMNGSAGSLFSLKSLVNPGTIGLALSLPFFLFSITLPPVIAVPVELMAGLNTPLAMMIIGAGLLQAKPDKVMFEPSVYVAAAIRLVGYPLLVLGVLYPFRHVLDRTLILALTISASAPVAAMVSMFAMKFKRDVDVSVAIVSGTTLLSILTIPSVIAFAMYIL